MTNEPNSVLNKISEHTMKENVREFLMILNDLIQNEVKRGKRSSSIKIRADCVLTRLENIYFYSQKGK